MSKAPVKPIKDPMIATINSQRKLKCVFTEVEKKEIAEGLALNLEEVDSLKDDLKAVSSDLKAKIAEKEASIQKYAGNIRNGYEYRDVKVVVTKDYRQGTVKIVRVDTDDLIEDRLMNAEERQMGFDLEKKSQVEEPKAEPPAKEEEEEL